MGERGVRGTLLNGGAFAEKPNEDFRAVWNVRKKKKNPARKCKQKCEKESACNLTFRGGNP